MASKQVTDRQKLAESVMAAGETQAETVGLALGAQFLPYLQEGETLPDFGVIVRLLTRSLNAYRNALVAADEAHETELADDPPARQDRDTKAQTLYARMIELREVLLGLYGSDVVQALMPLHTPSDPVVLSRYAGEVIGALSAAELPEPRIPGAALDIPTLVAELQAQRDALAAQLTVVAVEVREAQATMIARNRAMDAYDRFYNGVAGALSGMLHLAGEHELAARVRPSRRRPSRPAGDTVPAPLPEDTPTPTPAS